MFNEEIKRRYIEEKEANTKLDKFALTSKFAKIEAMEKELDKDCCNFTSYEIGTFYKTLNAKSLEVLTMYNSVYKLYTQWCIKQNLVEDNQNHYSEMNREVLSSCISSLKMEMSIFTRKQLMDYIRILPNERDRFLMMGVFEFGKTDDFRDVATLRNTDVEGQIIHLTNRDVNISSELARVIAECEKEKIYHCFGNGKKQKELELHCYDDRVFKYTVTSSVEKPSNKLLGRRIYQNFAKLLKYLGIEGTVRISDIMYSGQIDMVNRRAKELGMSGKAYVSSPYMDEVRTQYDNNIVRSTFLRKFEQFLI